LYFSLSFSCDDPSPHLHSFPTRRSSDLAQVVRIAAQSGKNTLVLVGIAGRNQAMCVITRNLGKMGEHLSPAPARIQELSYTQHRSEEHTSELQSPYDLVCRLLLEKKKSK